MSQAQTRVVTLSVQGMTCASCTARVEKRLNRLEGVSASVNLATESASVTAPTRVSDDDLLSTVARAGYSASVVSQEERAQDEAPSLGQSQVLRAEDLRERLVLSLVVSVPVMALSMVPALQVPGWQWMVAVMTLPVATWGAWPFHKAALRALRHATFTMDTLVSVGVVAATGWSVWALLWGGAGEIGLQMPLELMPRRQGHAAHTYFESAAWVTTFLLAGRLAEAHARHRSGDALRSLLELGAKEVTRVRLTSPSGSTRAVDVLDEEGLPLPQAQRTQETVPVEALAAGDLFMVHPGEKVATDGVVVEGRSAVDASVLTGESVPVDVSVGQEVTGATVSTSGALLVRASRVGAATTLARIGAMVTAAQAGKAPVQRLADQVSAVFVPAVMVLSALTLAGWLVTGHPLQQALMSAVAVLVIACPCALGLATPTALLVGSGRAAQLGVVIKGPEVLERTRALDVVVLDKTGTITQGRASLDLGDEDSVHAFGLPRPEALRLAGALETLSEHPVATAITTAARQSQGALPAVQDFSSHEGRGVSGVVEGHRAAVGRLSWLTEQGVSVPPEVTVSVAAAQENGATAVVLAVDERAAAVLVVRDTVRPSSRQAVSDLRQMGLRPVLLTGDNERAAHHVAREVGIAATDVRSEVLPGDKRDVVASLQEAGYTVAMVGDGVNDAAALAQASTQGLGIAMGSGSDVAIEAADVTLVRADLEAAVTAVTISRQTLRVIRQNLFWAFIYNVLGIPLAVAGLLNPMIAGGAMASSSVIVVLNSLRLRRAG